MKHTILVVDDERIVADTLGLIFEKRGFACHVAYTGLDALSRIQDFCPELLLCDISMPKMDGLDVASQVIRKCPACRVLLLTGHYTNLKFAREWAHEHPGQSRTVIKPVSPQQLLEEADALLHVDEHSFDGTSTR